MHLRETEFHYIYTKLKYHYFKVLNSAPEVLIQNKLNYSDVKYTSLMKRQDYKSKVKIENYTIESTYGGILLML